MVNYVCGFNQSETEKYFEWIIIIFPSTGQLLSSCWLFYLIFLEIMPNLPDRHFKFCKQNTAMLTVLHENLLYKTSTRHRQLKAEQDCNHRQLFCYYCSLSVWRNNQRKFCWKIFTHSDFSPNQGRIQEFLIWGVHTLVRKGLFNFFVPNYFSPTPHSTSCWEGRDDYEFLNLWTFLEGFTIPGI